ncbi:MotE family protein [Pannonibacter carbonis]|uniref:MotE family protein n=1 Tax=Pannonibacter carbonis TaxID=2067569 RepID=UPI001AD91A31|nr:MotE family protein [Pannonibacter carbonis]
MVRKSCLPARHGRRPSLVRTGLALAMAVLPFAPAQAQNAPQPKPQAVQLEEGTELSDAQMYCRNTGNAANDARLAWQTWNLIALEEKVKVRIHELERKRAEYEAWVERREKVLSEVEGHVVAIFQRMRPEAAAAQLATLDENTAVAVLVKLNARAASQILDEMEPARAAQLTHSMAGLTKSEAEGSL